MRDRAAPADQPVQREFGGLMAQQLTPDICVIGAGTGGLVTASAAAAFGVPVTLIEKGHIGGDGRNGGSVPSKALIAAAERANTLRNGARFGVKAVRFGVDFAAVSAHVRDVADGVAAIATRERVAALGVRVIDGAACFKDSRTVAVGDALIKARRFVIATGSSPVLPAIPGLADTPHVTTETAFDLTECPRHLIVIGASSVGLELAQAFRRLGAEVTVLETATPLASDDPECAAVVLDALIQEGVTLRTGVAITRVHRSLARIQVEIATPAGAETVEGTHLLVAAGRRPNVESLDLDAAGIRYETHGIVVDKRLRTTNKRVYAVGDVTGGPKFIHLANYHAELVVRHALFRQRVAVDHQVIPSVTYTDPELAQVGFLENEARAHSGAIRVLRWPYSDNDRARAERATKGHIKIITDRRGDILGATIVGAHAGENIAAWTLAVSQKLNIRAFAGLIVPYPTYSEVGKRAAMTYFIRGLTSSRVRRIIGWLRRLG
jgi:pyruvate/2-oxoglutarate dehydrogenase complex dihydrolipoamide dehydrogenase (E3) component